MQSSGINNTSECCLIIYGGNGVKKRRLEAEMAESKKQRKTGRGRGWGRGAAVTSCITHKTAISVTYESVEACRKKEKAASTFQKSSKNNYKQYESTLDLLSIMKLPIMLKAILHFPFRNEPLWFNFLFTLTSLVYFRFLLLRERLPTITGVQMLRSSTLSGSTRRCREHLCQYSGEQESKSFPTRGKKRHLTPSLEMQRDVAAMHHRLVGAAGVCESWWSSVLTVFDSARLNTFTNLMFIVDGLYSRDISLLSKPQWGRARNNLVMTSDRLFFLAVLATGIKIRQRQTTKRIVRCAARSCF